MLKSFISFPETQVSSEAKTFDFRYQEDPSVVTPKLTTVLHEFCCGESPKGLPDAEN